MEEQVAFAIIVDMPMLQTPTTAAQKWLDRREHNIPTKGTLAFFSATLRVEF